MSFWGISRRLGVFGFSLFVSARFVSSAPFEASAPGLLTVTGGGGGGCGQSVPMRWSDPDTWGGTLPVANDSVNIPACETIILDVVTPSLGIINIDGTLVADPSVDVGIMATSIYVKNGGTLQIGTVSQPYTRNATITLTGARGTHTPRNTGPLADNALDNDGLSRALRVMNGGKLHLFGATPPLLKTKLNANANAGATTLTLADSVNWKAGDRIAVSITDFYGVGQTEILTLANDANGTSLNTTSGLATFRWGRLQYPTDTGMSLTPGTFTPNHPTTPNVLDERAEIINLSRRIVIQGANDADWTANGFGAHVMIMGLASEAQVRGIEIRRAGQRRAMGRYPFHWHMLSYTAANAQGEGGGQYLGDVAPGTQYLEDSAIWDSQNRAVTIHGTCGVTVNNTYAVDIRGHAFFMEDGSERRNTITNNVAMKMRNPTNGNHLKLHDIENNYGGASGFWLTNPDNTVRFNSASDAQGRGLWNAFSPALFGLSRNVTGIQPNYIPITQFDDNTGHSNRYQGMVTDLNVTDEAGNTETRRYLQGAPVDFFFMRRNKTYKNGDAGYQNRVNVANYIEWTAADNNGMDFRGSTWEDSKMIGTLFVGSSLNSATPFADSRRVAAASYHYQLDISSIVAINYPYSAPAMEPGGPYVWGGGVLNMSDLYLFPIGLGGIRNVGWKLINSNAGYVTPPPYFDSFPMQVTASTYRHWTLPVSRDDHGYWSGHPDWYMVWNHPTDTNNRFFTYGLSSSVPSPVQPNLLFTPDRFFGIEGFQIDAPDGQEWWGNTQPYKTMRCARLDNGNVEVGHHFIGPANQAAFFGGFRHFSVKNGGRYAVTFPGDTIPTSYLIVWVKNAYRANDEFVVGLPWPGSVPAHGRLDSGYETSYSEAQRVTAGTTRVFSFTGNGINSVANDASGATAWQDTANNLVYVKVKGGLNYYNPSAYAGNDDGGLEKPMQIRIYP